jgi:hypothetical protein
MEWNEESRPLEARPLSRLVVEFRQPPLDMDSTVWLLKLLSLPGLSRPGL